MARGRLLVAMMVAGIFLVPMAAADRPAAWDLVGEDPAGDANNWAVYGVAELPASPFSRGKFDILSLWMASEPDTLHVKLVLDASYHGTTSALYSVFFKVGATSYFTCWNIQSAGTTTQSNDVNENFDLGCTRLNEFGTRVGPLTRAAGVDVASADGENFIRWPVPRSAIGNPEDGAEITDIVARVWTRSVNPDHAPATSPQSGYVWSVNDRAPDEGSWTYPLGGVPEEPELALNLSAEPTEATVGPGSVVRFGLGLSLAGADAANVTLRAENLTQGWEARFDPGAEVAWNATANLTEVVLRVHVPQAAENGTYAFHVVADAGDNVTAQANLTITVDTSLSPALDPTDPEVQDGANATADEANATGQDDADGGVIPSVGVLAALAVLGAAVSWRSRRRRQ